MPRRIKVHARTLERKGGEPGQHYWQLRWTQNGKEEFETLGWVTDLEAEHRRQRKEAQRVLGLSEGTSSLKQMPGVNVTDVLTWFGEDLDMRGVGATGYRNNVRTRSIPLVVHLGERLVQHLTTRDLDQYAYARRSEIGGRRGNRLPKKSTVIDEIKLIRRAIGLARKCGRTQAATPDMPRLSGWPDDHRPARRLALAEVATLIKGAKELEPKRYELARLIEFMAWCPRRPIAIFNLTRHDCRRVLEREGHHPEGDLWISRDKGQRELGWSPLTAAARRVLREQLQSRIGPADSPAWVRQDGKAWDNASFRNVLVRLTARLKLDHITPYDLRKFAAVRVHLAARGQGKVTIRFTGHASTQVLESHYLYADPETVELASNADWGKNG